MGAPAISNPRVLVELQDTHQRSTRVISVLWDLPHNVKSLPDGEWAVEWADMYAELSDDVRSARSEQGGYFALRREQGDKSAASETSKPNSALPDTTMTESPKLDPAYNESLPTGPLSTAKLLEFENGPNFREVQEDLGAFFASRPIVQAPAQIIPDTMSPTKKTEVHFLLTGAASFPGSVRILFTPTWTPPNTPPHMLAEIPQSEFKTGQGLHTTWAERRLLDLKTLEEIAQELELEGSRGIGQGRVKVGVEGGGMDEEAVRREGWMVGEEKGWVKEQFLDTTSVSQASEMLDPLRGLGINSGLKLQTGSDVTTPAVSTPAEEEEDELFALPLSPRSPEMAVSPFSMFRGESKEGQTPTPTKLRMVDNSSSLTPTSVETTPTTARLALLTPPRDG